MILPWLPDRLDRMKTSRLAATVAAVAALVGLAAAPAAATPEFTFADCPTVLPTGADPAKWRCEEMAATGTVQFGTLPTLDLPMLRMTFAEGTLDGHFAQTFGALRAEPVRIPRSHLSLRFQYGGFSDFQSNDQRMGEVHLKLAVEGFGVPSTCTIGTDAEPIRFVVKRQTPTEVVSTNPLVVRFSIADTAFTVPRSSGCGPFRRMIDKRLGLPSTEGNSLVLHNRVGIRGY